MARRTTKNTTSIPRNEGIQPHDAWCSYTCIACGTRNQERIGQKLLKPIDAYENCSWKCSSCNFVHSKKFRVPFSNWPRSLRPSKTLSAQRFWRAFFRSATEKPESYWKQCNVCNRILPNADFSRHNNWGPLEKQMECRACKAAINALLNPQRTSEQLRESGMKRRIAELLTRESDEKLDVVALFERFGSKCFKTGKELNIEDASSWQIDHTLPSKYFYPLTVVNATLLSKDANQNKSDKWPSEFYTNKELVELAKITGASLELLSSPKPTINKDIDVNGCVKKFLNVRDETDLSGRVSELKMLLEKHELLRHLSKENKDILGL